MPTIGKWLFLQIENICLLSTTSLKIALFMDNKLRLNIAGPGQEINVPECFEIDRIIEI